MTLNELKYIVAVAVERHFGNAAKRCFVSQPTLSVAIRKIEKELGVKLFERGQGEVKVTPIGSKIISQAQQVLEEASAINKIASQGQNQLKGPIRFGGMLSVGPILYPSLIPKLIENVPEMPLYIETDNSSNLLEALRQGNLDIALISLPINEPTFETRLLYTEPLVAILPKNHYLTYEKNLTLEQMGNERVFLLDKNHCLRDLVLESCPSAQNPPIDNDSSDNFPYEADALINIAYMVAANLGVSIVPSSAAATFPLSGSLLEVREFKNEPPRRQIALAWRRSYHRPEAVHKIADTILECNLSNVEMVI